jgi:hypothetical protein
MPEKIKWEEMPKGLIDKCQDIDDPKVPGHRLP